MQNKEKSDTTKEHSLMTIDICVVNEWMRIVINTDNWMHKWHYSENIFQKQNLKQSNGKQI